MEEPIICQNPSNCPHAKMSMITYGAMRSFSHSRECIGNDSLVDGAHIAGPKLICEDSSRLVREKTVACNYQTGREPAIRMSTSLRALGCQSCPEPT
jgi:hypothetical protein